MRLIRLIYLRYTKAMNQQFNIPVVVFFFKRVSKTIKIINQLSKIQPSCLYLISDGARNSEEALLVNECRKKVEEAVNWQCKVYKNYASVNEGVFNRIALGVKWVFETTDEAIFLEDDNLPELSFFDFCKEMLEKYKNIDRILWICGTNYIEKFEPTDGSDYVFTSNMLPCGWASWKTKFEKYYDGYLELWEDPYIQKRIKYEYKNKKLMKQDINRWNKELLRKKNNQRFNSWDAQMAFSIRANDLLGIVPKYNQIRNIGVDENSIHGGTSFNNVMTKRFCEIPTQPLEFPLKHPKLIIQDLIFEKKISQIITLPLKYRIKGKIISFLKFILLIDQDKSFSEEMRYKIYRLLKK